MWQGQYVARKIKKGNKIKKSWNTEKYQQMSLYFISRAGVTKFEKISPKIKKI